ncbi:MAG TPA: CehA/McbA family metallohydrolase [Pirellulales bacterium]|nr:CehA/McbA family metallohydrolase [Pirellulales bacterium]
MLGASSLRLQHCLLLGICLASVSNVSVAEAADELPIVRGVEPQPLKAQVARVVQALDLLGNPLPADQKAALEKALKAPDSADSVEQVQAALDPLCLVGVNINPESRVKVVQGPAPRKLVEQGWRVFLVKVHNEAGVTAPLRVSSPNSEAVYKRSSGKPNAAAAISKQEVENRWLEVSLYDQQPLNKELSGLALEYRIIQLFSRDRDKREAKLMFDVGQGTQDLGFRNEVNLLFFAEAAVKVVLNVLDDDGQPTIGQFVFKDAQGRVYPSRVKRLAPDLFFHDQVYRASGESVLLPPGIYEATYTRGPEYRILKRMIQVPAAETHEENFRLARWIKLADMGWYSGDHHVHGAGCAHYEAPTEGVGPEDMVRHIIGEDLNVGCVLSWGPCWYFQKKFFEGEVHRLSKPQNLMRYDVEVSGFPSSHCGHLCLLRLKEDDYPGTSKIEDWPSWDLPVLAWGKEQGGIVGFSHSGWGLQVASTTLPNHEMPKFDGIGANEYIVDVVHGVCDFISAVDTPIVWELNIWYQTLNCGYTARISGETDFPCIYGERVGLGRAYVKLNPGDGPLDYDQWAYGIRDGRSYCCDGLSHLIDFKIRAGDEELGVGEKGAGGRASFMKIKSGQKLVASVKAAAMLEEQPREDIRSKPLDQKPYWHVERARIAKTRRVPVELIVNGESIDTKEMDADGRLEELEFDFAPEKSCWVALRIFPSSHTNPVFVEVDDQPIRASKKSAQWCLDAVDVCWRHKSPAIREGAERDAAEKAFEVARQAYRKVLGEATGE